jgi:hypothetical protein
MNKLIGLAVTGLVIGVLVAVLLGVSVTILLML